MSVPYRFEPITQRPPLHLPGAARVALWVGVNIEHYQWGKPALSLAQFTSEFVPDPLNVGWRDYGPRVGVWRILEGFAGAGLPLTGIVNAAVCEEYPQIVEAGTAQGLAWVAHGWDNSTLQTFLPPDEEAAYIDRVTKTIEDATGARPRGWLGPVLSSSAATLDLLAGRGYDYNLDWACDDAPFDFEVASGRLISVPYASEVNDIPAFLFQGASATGFAGMIRAAVDQLSADASTHPRVLGVGIHPFLVGQPARFGPFLATLRELAARDDVWFTTSDAVANAYLSKTGHGYSQPTPSPSLSSP